MEWEDKIQGSSEQKRYKERCLSGGVFTPREYGGTTTFMSKNSYLNQQLHGLPSGFSTMEKKYVKLKIAGGNMHGVLHNQYFEDFIKEADERDQKFQQNKKNSKIDLKKFFKTRALEKRNEYNRKKIKLMEQDMREEMAKFPQTTKNRDYDRIFSHDNTAVSGQFQKLNYFNDEMKKAGIPKHSNYLNQRQSKYNELLINLAH